MPETFSCPQCGVSVRMLEHLAGKLVKCPACGGTFTAAPPVEPPLADLAEDEPRPAEPKPKPPRLSPVLPPPDDAEEDEPDLDRPLRRDLALPAAELPAWFSARAGVRLQMVSHCLYLGGLACLVILLLIALSKVESDYSPSSRNRARIDRERTSRAGDEVGSVTAVIILTVLGGLALTATWITAVVAGCFLAAGPARRRARGLAIGVVILAGLAVLLQGEIGRYVLMMRDYEDSGSSREFGETRFARLFVYDLVFLLIFEVTRLTLLALLLRAQCLLLRLTGRAAAANLLGVLTLTVVLGLALLYLLVVVCSSPGPAGRMVLMLSILLALIGMLIYGWP